MTATLLTPAQLREHVETDLSDGALQRILDSEEAEIVGRYGAHATASEMLAGDHKPLLILARDAASITAITETVADVDTALAADDYRLWPGGRLERLSDGTHPASTWGDRVAVTYVPADQVAQRSLVLVNLCKLALEYRGLKSEAIGSGDYQMTAQEYNAERNRLLGSLAPRGGLWFA